LRKYPDGTFAMFIGDGCHVFRENNPNVIAEN
jgi:hypothetical protein